ncbi:MAG: FtsX-like permease family protein [Verrucomicrobia bacterium]|nr:FtsX-like permease family protein [Verrucomicrobiota bacterium]
MLGYALKMLVGDRLKYIGLILALSFASFIISQQGAIFIGIMKRTCSFIIDTSQPDIWVMNPTVQYVDDLKGMKETALYRVRSMDGIDWAVPMYKGTIQARLRNGKFQSCILIGIDDATLIGGPPRMIQGSLQDLRFPDAILVNEIGAKNKMASPGLTPKDHPIPLHIGDTCELNDRRAYVAGICYTARTFQSQPVIYTTYNRATTISPQVRDVLTFILVKAAPGVDPEVLAKKITATTGYAAYTSWGFQKLTMMYYAYNTGIVVNFGVAILLGFIIGVAIAGQTFFNFITDNLPYFGTLKAMGASNRLLIKMVVLQALFVGCIGFGIGIGCTAIFGYAFQKTELSFSLPFWLYGISGFSILLICFISALSSVMKVIRLDPAIVFKG